MAQPVSDEPPLKDPVRLKAGPLSLAVHAALIFHVIAVSTGPSSIPPSSSVQRGAWAWTGPYLQATYLNHGYHYFAPDPGESSLLEFVAVRADGTEVSGVMPRLDDSWPRLLYHRDFMLTETLPSRLDGPVEERNAYLQALADGLGNRYDAERVRLTHLRHLLPTAAAIRGGFPLDDPAQYLRRELGTFACR